MASAGAAGKLGARVIWELAHSHVWQLMLTVDWGLSCGRQLDHLHMASTCGSLASSQHGGWVSRQKVNAASFLKPESGSWQSITSIIFYSSRSVERKFKGREHKLFQKEDSQRIWGWCFKKCFPGWWQGRRDGKMCLGEAQGRSILDKWTAGTKAHQSRIHLSFFLAGPVS